MVIVWQVILVYFGVILFSLHREVLVYNFYAYHKDEFEYERNARRVEKQKKKNSWAYRGGYIAPIFVPPTPNGDLANALKQIAESEAEAWVNFRIVENGGRSIKSMVQQSNPTGNVVSLGLPVSLERWSNEQVLKFILFMWYT